MDHICWEPVLVQAAHRVCLGHFDDCPSNVDDPISDHVFVFGGFPSSNFQKLESVIISRFDKDCYGETRFTIYPSGNRMLAVLLDTLYPSVLTVKVSPREA
jgi:hypothetical protein